jgi:predicted DNA-binding antitoxin AbrB/MazE fold protein
MMARVVEAIYENGTLKPFEALDLPEHQRVRITIHELIVESPDETLEAWHQVYEGCAEEDIAQIEAIALDRSWFMRQEPQAAMEPALLDTDTLSEIMKGVDPHVEDHARRYLPSSAPLPSRSSHAMRFYED